MESFNRVEHGYDPEEVNAFLDQVIDKVELLVEDYVKIVVQSTISMIQRILQKKNLYVIIVEVNCIKEVMIT